MKDRWMKPTMAAALLGGALFATAIEVGAQDKELGWFNTTELTFVLTGGNATASTLGVKSALDRVWESDALRFAVGSIRTESGSTIRLAQGTADDFTVMKTTTDELTAANYFARSRYDRSLSEHAFIYAGAGWDRNTFAGVQNRYNAVTGAGRVWFETDAKKLRTDVGVTYTVQDDVVSASGDSESFLGLRASYEYLRSLTETTDFASGLIVDENLDETSDFRADWINSISVQMSEGLALKASLQLLFDNLPALAEIPLDGFADTTVLSPLEKTDSVFTIALVLGF